VLELARSVRLLCGVRGYLVHHVFLSTRPRPPAATLFPYTTLFRSSCFHRRKRFAKIRNLSRALRAVLQMQFRCASIYRVKSVVRSEEHTSELQSRENLVCRLLLEKKKARNTSSPREPLPRGTTSPA